MSENNVLSDSDDVERSLLQTGGQDHESMITYLMGRRARGGKGEGLSATQRRASGPGRSWWVLAGGQRPAGVPWGLACPVYARPTVSLVPLRETRAGSQ